MTPSPVQLPALGVTLAGRYRILEKIGSGGVGDVYRAFDEKTQANTVVKFWRMRSAAQLDAITRSFDTAVAASQLRHPHVVRVHETGFSEFGPFLVMEELRGDHIGKTLARHGRLKKEHCFAIVEPVLTALEAAHSGGLLHGALKPENVLVSQMPGDGVTVKVLDFGTTQLNGTFDDIADSVDYLAPEQLEGRPVDHRADVYAACILLFELLTNSLPFHAPTTMATVQRVLYAPCPSFQQMGISGLEMLTPVLLRGLAKDPSQRFASARELLDAIRPSMQSNLPYAQLLGEILPLASMLRQDSLTMSVAASRSNPPSIPSPESGARLLPATKRSSLFPPSSRAETLTPVRDTPAPVLPSRFRGRFRARAVVWQSLDIYVRARRPAKLRERILSDMGTDDASDLLLGTLQGIRYLDLDSVTQYIDLVTARLYGDDVNWCRAAGREAVEGVFSMALTRSIPPSPTAVATTTRVCRILSPLFDFGDWQVDEVDGGRRALVTISSIDAMCQGLRLWLLGIFERSLAVAHSHFSIAIARGEAAFMPRLVIEAQLE